MSTTGLARARRAALFAAAALLLPGLAAADRALLILEQSVTGQTNLFRDVEDEESGGTYEVRPRLRFVRPAEDFSYVVEYAPTYDVYFDTSGVDGFDQFGRAEVAYAYTPVDRVTLNSDLSYYRSIRSDRVDAPGGSSEILSDVSGRVFRALADVGYEHAFNRTTVGSARLDFQSYSYTTPNNADSLGFGGTLEGLHELSPIFAVGATGFASHRRFDELTPQPESNNVVLHGAPLLRWLPTETLQVEAAVGPGWIRTDRDAVEGFAVSRFQTMSGGSNLSAAVFSGCGTAAGVPLLSLCPFAPAGFAAGALGPEDVFVDYPGDASSHTESTLTAFAHASIENFQEWGSARLAYRRGEDASSGSGATSIRDAVTATLTFGIPASLWELRLRGNWNQRETVERLDSVEAIAGPSTVPAGAGIFFAEAEGLVVVDRARRRVVQYWTDVAVRRRLLDSLSIELSGRYLRQERYGTSLTDDEFDNWSGRVMLRYEPAWLRYDW
jgi:hypothetical protein